MEPLSTLRELQTTLDYLGTIHRELSSLPPDLGALDTRVKTAEKQIAEKTKALDTARASIQVKLKEMVQAQKDEDRARGAVKTTSQKVQYTAAIRELDEKERLKAAVVRPLKILEAGALALEKALAILESDRVAAQTQFDELYAIFLDEHSNQVEGRKTLKAKQAKLEAKLPSAEIARFHRLAAARHGKVVVLVENGACTGCNMKLRSPLLFELKEAKTLVTCECCQRVLFLP